MEQTINCIAVDDDAPALRVIEQYINKLPQLKLVAKFRNPLEATDWLKTNKADILFLDIQMQQQSGLTMLKALPVKPLTIFTTAYSEFAADAFDLEAIGDVVAHIHMGEQRVILEHSVYITLIRRQAGGFLAMDANRACARLLEPGDQAQAGGLARAGRAEHGKELAVLDIDGNPVYGFHFAEKTGNVGELDCKRHGAVLQKGEGRRSGPAWTSEKSETSNGECDLLLAPSFGGRDTIRS